MLRKYFRKRQMKKWGYVYLPKYFLWVHLEAKIAITDYFLECNCKIYCPKWRLCAKPIPRKEFILFSCYEELFAQSKLDYVLKDVLNEYEETIKNKVKHKNNVVQLRLVT